MFGFVKTMTKPSAPSAHVLSRWAASLAAGVWGFVLLCRPLAENDIFWHLTLGRAVLRAGSRVVPEPTAAAFFSPQALAPEWLWEVIAWWTWDGGGPTALILAVAAMGALSFTSIALFLFQERSAPGEWKLTLLAIVCGAAAVRLKERPETLALALTAVFLVACTSFHTKQTWQRGLIVLSLAVIWAQIHGTFVLAPILFAIEWVHRRSSFRGTMALLVLLVLSLGSGPHGFDVADFIASHVSGDAVRHITDMRAPTASDWAQGPYLWLASIETGLAVLACIRKDFTFRSVLLAGLGLGIGMLSLRGVSLWALFMAPLALRGLQALPSQRWLPLGLTALLVVLVTRRVHERSGPLFSFRVVSSELPAEAVAVLAPLPAGSVVWTSYLAGAGFGLLDDGRLRITQDSRTPLHFDDTDYAVNRAAMSSESAFQRAAEAMNIQAAVVERSIAECQRVSQHPEFVPAAVNAHYATFVRRGRGVDSLTTINPCEPLFLNGAACSGAFEADLVRLRPAGESLVNLLRQAHAVRCGGNPKPEVFPAALDEAAGQHRWVVQSIWGKALLKPHQYREAVAMLLPSATGGFSPSFTPLMQAASQLLPEERWPALQRVALQLDDATPVSVLSVLATTAAELDWPVAARFYALRAAALGASEVTPVLRAVGQIDTMHTLQLRAWERREVSNSDAESPQQRQSSAKTEMSLAVRPHFFPNNGTPWPPTSADSCHPPLRLIQW